jgi:hypothetical protein
MFSARSMPRCYKWDNLGAVVNSSLSWWKSLSEVLVGELLIYLDNRWDSVASCCCKKLVVEGREISEIQRKGIVRRWKPLPKIGSEDVTVDTSLRVRECASACNSEL